MPSHEKLKKICDKIGYSIPEKIDYILKSEEYYYNGISGFAWYFKGNGMHFNVDVREIIFTQEFMDKYKEHLKKIMPHYSYNSKIHNILNNLDNPVDYLYNLIFKD